MSRYDLLLSHRFPTIDHQYTRRDTILYALGCGAGADELDLVYERDLLALPTLASMLAHPGNWYADPALCLDAVRVVHASERIELLADLPVEGHLTATQRIVAIHDRGLRRGAMITSQRDIFDAQTGRQLATVTQRALCRGDGGLGGPAGTSAPVGALIPDRAPDRVAVVQSSPHAAAIFRLMGDDNPLHIDPVFAAAAGFATPILHGLSTLGHVARAILRDAPRRSVRMMAARFTAPVVPGDALQVDLWDTEEGRAFRARVGRCVVIDNGEVTFGG